MPTMTARKRRPRKMTAAEREALLNLLSRAEAERKRRGLNQTEAAELLGLTQNGWSQLVAGKKRPSGPVRKLLVYFVSRTI